MYVIHGYTPHGWVLLLVLVYTGSIVGIPTCLLISDLSEKFLSWPTASQPARGQTAACKPPASRLRPAGRAPMRAARRASPPWQGAGVPCGGR